MPYINLKSSDGIVFRVDAEILKCSIPLKTMVEHLCLDEKNCEEPIPLQNVHSTVVGKILEWATYHKHELEALNEVPRERRTDDISDWDKEFMKIEKPLLYAIMMAADYLNISGLTTLTSKTVANMIKGKSVRELRETFDLPDDIPKEDETINQVNKMLEDYL